MQYQEIKTSDVPLPLLLEADPSEASINTYLKDSWCFAAIYGGRVVGVCVATLKDEGIAEIVNVSVYPDFQQKGIGSDMLRFALAQLATKNVKRVELGTGTFGYQLTYYQRLGFRVDAVVKDYFIEHYPKPIFEHGIQHQDMLRLYRDL
ncbi:GCN5 family acetyltransferase [Photobacterium aquae]|uniref:GCN5 family acetyltransferase n=1 Tax=Photobacterium aquae TaxID=1195763 RepID=A0A0J1H0A3_9GAMM|nr:GNAT family N-acetyltransferase [Photobacterium aquae]KLV05251.1 GCN5 family acetyltransferase [Photobacterium aquae]